MAFRRGAEGIGRLDRGRTDTLMTPDTFLAIRSPVASRWSSMLADLTIEQGHGVTTHAQSLWKHVLPSGLLIESCLMVEELLYLLDVSNVECVL